MTRSRSLPVAVVLLVFGCLAPAARAEETRPPRVLLAAGGAMRDYQFLRNLVIRLTEKGLADMAFFMQPPPGRAAGWRLGITADLPPRGFLTRFPDAACKPGDDADEKYYNPAHYDVIVVFDLDWERIEPKAVAGLRGWVKNGGTLVLVAGPVNTPKLAAEPKAERDQQVRDLYPVVLDRGSPKGDREHPWRLHFPKTKADRKFLKLDPGGDDDLAGWEEFFTGNKKFNKDATLERGFFNYQPAKAVKKGATVLATLADPSAKLADGSEQPFLVTMPLGKGRVVYLTSGELWRLRAYREAMHERLWMQILNLGERR